MADFNNKYKPLILIVDDIPRNLQVLGTILYNEGYEVALADSGIMALNILENNNPDLILLDIMMPDIDGFEVCRRINENNKTKDIPVIFLTAKTEADDIIKGFAAGGVDYVTKPFKKEELLARIKIHIELKRSKQTIKDKIDEIEVINQQLIVTNKEKEHYLNVINTELDLAAKYVRSMIPNVLTTPPLITEWLFIPSARLGGDSFGYHWIDNDNFAFYLLDVCGHGIGSTLMSMSALNTIKFQTLSVDFKEPEQVFNALNNAFDMVKHNDLYFSIWYGVINIPKSELVYSSAGHPPAICFSNNQDYFELQTRNLFIGTIPNRVFITERLNIKKGTSIFLYSDGAFEFKTKENKIWGLANFKNYFKENAISNDFNLNDYYYFAKSISKNDSFEDDFSILKINYI